MTVRARTYAATVAVTTPDRIATTILAVRARLHAAGLVRLGPILVEVFTGDELAAAGATVAELGLADSPLVALFRDHPRDVALVVGVVQVTRDRDRWN